MPPCDRCVFEREKNSREAMGSSHAIRSYVFSNYVSRAIAVYRLLHIINVRLLSKFSFNDSAMNTSALWRPICIITGLSAFLNNKKIVIKIDRHLFCRYLKIT